ncbi:MAG: hypothetical protein NC429_02705 [Lachnospiraceae bacterium]|nr:hypothetical protein [Lachnospiraceae bacterium]
MENNDLRNTPDYGILENYANEEKQYHNFDEFRKNHVEEIRQKNPDVWEIAKQDFNLYKMWQ